MYEAFFLNYVKYIFFFSFYKIDWHTDINCELYKGGPVTVLYTDYEHPMKAWI